MSKFCFSFAALYLRSLLLAYGSSLLTAEVGIGGRRGIPSAPIPLIGGFFSLAPPTCPLALDIAPWKTHLHVNNHTSQERPKYSLFIGDGSRKAEKFIIIINPRLKRCIIYNVHKMKRPKRNTSCGNYSHGFRNTSSRIKLQAAEVSDRSTK